MKLRNLAVFALAGVLALTACGKEGDSGSDNDAKVDVESNVTVDGSATFDKMKSRGKVIIGVKEDQPNLGYKDPTTGKYSGFDISIAKLVAAKLGFAEEKIEFKAIPTPNREQAIVNGDIDYYVGTYSITDKRKAQIAFAGPYFIAGQDLLVRKEDNSITGPDTIKGKTVCSAKGSTPIKNIKENKAKYGAETVEFDKYSDCVRELLGGKVDAVTTDDAILKGYAAQQPNLLKVVGKTFSTEKYGIGLPKADKALRDKVNAILDASFSDGEWKKIYDATLGKSGSPASPPALERY
jgi:glutamate transport system substrate-binding protein